MLALNVLSKLLRYEEVHHFAAILAKTPCALEQDVQCSISTRKYIKKIISLILTKQK